MAVSETTVKARPGANPVPGRRLPFAIPAGRLAAKTAPKAARTILTEPRTGSIEEIEAHKRALVVTYRKDGTPVPTPVWAAEGGGRLYVRSERTCGKVKRLRKDNRVLIAPCTVRGKPLGPPFEATGRLIDPHEEPYAERTLSRRYTIGRALFEWTMDRLHIDMGYLEIVPEKWPVASK